MSQLAADCALYRSPSNAQVHRITALVRRNSASASAVWRPDFRAFGLRRGAPEPTASPRVRAPLAAYTPAARLERPVIRDKRVTPAEWRLRSRWRVGRSWLNLHRGRRETSRVRSCLRAGRRPRLRFRQCHATTLAVGLSVTPPFQPATRCLRSLTWAPLIFRLWPGALDCRDRRS